MWSAAPVRVNGAAVTIAGVTPRGFFGERPGSAPDVWLPMQLAGMVTPPESASPDFLNNRGSASITPMGRLKFGVPAARAQAELSALYSELHDLSPHNIHATAYSMQLASAAQGLGGLEAEYAAPLRLLMAIATLVLLMACCNVANLLLAHACARTHEFGVRLALGASRRRLLRQLLTESALLAAAGAGLGFLAAQWGSNALVGLASGGESLRLELAPDARVFAFALTLPACAVLLFGLAPAIAASRADVRSALQAPRADAAGRPAIRLLRVFMTAQVAASLTLVTGAALLAHSFHNLSKQDFGYRPDGLLLVKFKVDRALLALRDPARMMPLANRLAAIPGVRSAALGGPGPLAPMQTAVRLSAPGQDAAALDAMEAKVSAGYFETMKIPILAGRGITDADRAETASMVVLSQTAALRLFGRENPVGRTVAFENGGRLEIAGVARDVRANGPRDEFQPIVYVPMTQQGRMLLLTAALRTQGDPAALASAVRQAVRKELPSLRIDSVSPVPELLEGMMRRERMLALLSGAFGLLALLVAAAGLYGVIAYSVERRTRELGIRLALGAGRVRLVRMLLAEMAGLLLAGLPLGLCGTFLLAHWLRSVLFGIAPGDAGTIGSRRCAAGRLRSRHGIPPRAPRRSLRADGRPAARIGFHRLRPANQIGGRASTLQ